MNPTTPKAPPLDPYKILNVSADSSPKEIKQARDRLARIFHPDKEGGSHEKIQDINNAYEKLTNPSDRERINMDREDGVPSEATQFLSCGHKRSDDFIESMNRWKFESYGQHDYTCFSDKSLPNTVFRNASINLPEQCFQQLLDQPGNSVNEIIIGLVLKRPTSWGKEVKIDKRIIHLEAWDHDGPPISPSYVLPTKSEFEKIRQEIKFFLSPSHHSDTPYIETPKNKPFELFPKASGLVFPRKPQRCWGVLEPDIRKKLGHFPIHREIDKTFAIARAAEAVSDDTVAATRAQKAVINDTVTRVEEAIKERAECFGCNQTFGIFRWRYECIVCKKETCADCQEQKELPDYDNPVSVCARCIPNLVKYYKSGWVDDLNESSIINRVTLQYLLVLDERGFATRKQFSQLVDKFIQCNRLDLAIQCYFSTGENNWFSLADKLFKAKKYKEALQCINIYQKGNKYLKIKKKTKDEWIQAGDSFAKENKPTLAIACYQKAGFKVDQFVTKAQEFSYEITGIACLLMIKEMTPSRSWVSLVNDIPHDLAEMSVNLMYAFFKIDLNSNSFNLDKDHLRWPFLDVKKLDGISGKSNISKTILSEKVSVPTPSIVPEVSPFGDPIPEAPSRSIVPEAPFVVEDESRINQKFDVWLDCLIDLLKKNDGKYCIPYFRTKMKDENFIAHRDTYLANGEYEKALICHCLTPRRISWTELSRKWHKKDELATLACYLVKSDNLEKTGDAFFESKYYSLALLSYLQAKNFDKIELRANSLQGENKKLYLIALYEFDRKGQDKYVLSIARELLSDPNNADAAKELLLSIIKSGFSALPYQLLAETSLSLPELFGLLDRYSKKMPDKDWYSSTLSKAQNRLAASLADYIRRSQFPSLWPIVNCLNSTTRPAVEKIINDFSLDKWENGPQKAAGLFVRAALNWLNPNGAHLLSAMNDLTQAMLCFPSEECVTACSQLVEKINSNQSDMKLRGKGVTNTLRPKKIEYSGKLVPNTDLTVLYRSEKAIEKFDSLSAAMSYLDLTMGSPGGAGIVGCLMQAATKLFDDLKNKEDDDKYAYRRGIVQLIKEANGYAISLLCPTTQLYVMRASIAILTKTFEQFKWLRSDEQATLEVLYQEADKLFKLAPMVMSKMVMAYDLIYLDLINHSFLAHYLKQRRDALGPVQGFPFQYQIYRGLWRGWLAGEGKFDFDKEREATMRQLLDQKGYKIDHVEDLMQWPALKRDEEGWLSEKAEPLNLPGETFARVDSIRFNHETGEIELLLTTTENPDDQLFNREDIVDILMNGVNETSFSLDQPDLEHDLHPCQEMVYEPKTLSKTNYLGTVLHADILLKMLSVGSEISGKIPFKQRNTDDHLLHRLPEEYRDRFKVLREHFPNIAGRVHRFWIEAGELSYTETYENSVMTYQFGRCPMSVKKHLMTKDADGKLIDAEDTETDSPEARFAKVLTDEYDGLGLYFPELARLEELAKLQGVVKLMQQEAAAHYKIKQTMKEAKIPLQQKNPSVSDLCTWVPAAFYKGHGYRVYGGVKVNPTMVKTSNLGPSNINNNNNGGNNGDGSGGGGSSKWAPIRARYVESSTVAGALKGNMTCNYQGEIRQSLKLEKNIQDEWNTRKTNVNLLWRSYHTEVEHYTNHTHGSIHVHHRDGTVDCKGPTIETTYQKINRDHLCK